MRYSTVSFGLQFLAVSVGALTDFFVGKLTDKLSLAVLGWLVATLFASAMLALFADRTAVPAFRHSQSAWTSLSRWFAVHINQSKSRAAWPSIANAAMISLLAVITYCMLMLALVVLRYSGQVKSSAMWLGSGSPFDHFVISEAVGYQLSQTAIDFAGAVLLIGLVLRPPLVLPAGIMIVGCVNGTSLYLPPLHSSAQGPPTQLVAPLFRIDSYLLQLPRNLVVLGCLGLLACCFAMCGIIHRRIAAKGP